MSLKNSPTNPPKDLYPYDIDLISLLDKQVQDPPWDYGRYKPAGPLPSLWPTDSSVEVTLKNGVKVIRGSCNRSTWYRINKYPETEKPESRMYWIWRTGNWLEGDATAILKQLGMLAGTSCRFIDNSQRLPISGEMDAVCKFLDDKGKENLFVIDWKTAGGGYYTTKSLLGNKSTTPMPKIQNLLQIMVYLNVDPNLKFGKLVYFLREDLNRCEFTIRLQDVQGKKVANIKSVKGDSSRSIVFGDENVYPEYSIEEIYRRYNEVMDYYFKKEVPPADFDIEYSDARAKELFDAGELSKTQYTAHMDGDKKGDFLCRYCPYKTQCLKDR